MTGICYLSASFRKAILFGFFSVISALPVVAAQSSLRIRSEIDDSQRFALSGSVRPSLAYAQDQGPASESLSLPLMTIHFAPSSAQKADLQQLLQLQQNRHSTQFHKWLTTEQYADRFGVNEKDMQKMTAWLELQGFSNIQAAHSRTFITFGGTAARAQAAFHTSIHNYLTHDGRTHYANATEPEFPMALNGMVESIHGLHDFHPKPHSRPRFTSSVSGNHYLTPDDWATIYDAKSLYNSGIDGTGRSIAIPGQTDLVLADIETFQTNVGLPVKDPQVVLAGIDPGVQVTLGDLSESDLDIEWAGAIAKGASIIFVTSTDVTDSETYIVDNNVADVLSITYGDCESDLGAPAENSLNSLFQQASALGMTVTAASGDQGAADCDGNANSNANATFATLGLAVDVPAALPYVTGVGGTEFSEGTATGGTSYWNSTNNANNGSALSYIPETAWNDSTEDDALSASGGGASILFGKPTWQTGTGVPSDGKRDVPDVSLSGSADHDSYLTCTETGSDANHSPTCVVGFRLTANGNLNVAGGTSATSPAMAAVVALLDQKYGARQGLINPNLYTLASISSNAFHDITTGNNVVSCQVSATDTGCTAATGATLGTLGYSAGVGYDQVTGLGSIDAANLVSQWSDDFSLASNPTTLTVSPGTSGTATITVKPFGTFSGSVAFTCTISSAITNTTCSIPGTVTGGSGSVTLTVAAGATAHTPWWRGLPQNPRILLFVAMALLLTAGVYRMTGQRKLQMAGVAFMVLLSLGLTACGGGSSSNSTSIVTGTNSAPASVTGSVIVTATSGSLTNSTTITLTVP